MHSQPPTGAPQTQEDQDREMAHLGITAERRTFYRYQGYAYERLADALAYARIDAARPGAPTTDRPDGKAP